MCQNPIRKFPVINYQPPPTGRTEEKALRQPLAVCPPDFKDVILFGVLTGLRPQGIRLQRRLHRWCKKAGVERISPYAWRHTFASLESEAGVNQISLAGLMGHTTVRTTARYVTNSADFPKAAANGLALRLQAILGDDTSRAKTGQKVATKVATNETRRGAGERRTYRTDWQTAV